MSPKALELFHALADGESARVRRAVATLGLSGRVEFRNVHFESHAQALAALGGAATPALWDGTRLFVGADAVLARLDAAARSPAP